MNVLGIPYYIFTCNIGTNTYSPGVDNVLFKFDRGTPPPLPPLPPSYFPTIISVEHIGGPS